MQVKHVVIALGALATFLVVRGRPMSSELAPSGIAPGATVPAEQPTHLEMMPLPAGQTPQVVEPRVDVIVTQVSAGRTTPTDRTPIPPRPANRASAPPNVRASAPATVAAPPPPPTRAPAPAPGRLAMQPASRLWFDGKSTVKDFSCKADSIVAVVATTMPNAAPAVVAGEKSVSSVELSVPVAALDCENGTMNEHMRKALEMKDHPVILFSLRSYDLEKAAAGVAVTLTGSLTIRGQARPVTIMVQGSGADAGGLHLVGVYELNMKDFGVKPPSLMLGTMNVREKVKVRFDLLLKD